MMQQARVASAAPMIPSAAPSDVGGNGQASLLQGAVSAAPHPAPAGPAITLFHATSLDFARTIMNNVGSAHPPIEFRASDGEMGSKGLYTYGRVVPDSNGKADLSALAALQTAVAYAEKNQPRAVLKITVPADALKNLNMLRFPTQAMAPGQSHISGESGSHPELSYIIMQETRKSSENSSGYMRADQNPALEKAYSMAAGRTGNVNNNAGLAKLAEAGIWGTAKNSVEVFDKFDIVNGPLLGELKDLLKNAVGPNGKPQAAFKDAMLQQTWINNDGWKEIAPKSHAEIVYQMPGIDEGTLTTAKAHIAKMIAKPNDLFNLEASLANNGIVVTNPNPV